MQPLDFTLEDSEIIRNRMTFEEHASYMDACERDSEAFAYANSMRGLASSYSKFFLGDSQRMGLPAINNAASYVAWRIKASLRVYPKGQINLIY